MPQTDVSTVVENAGSVPLGRFLNFSTTVEKSDLLPLGRFLNFIAAAINAESVPTNLTEARHAAD
jgi:hypothetical protein